MWHSPGPGGRAEVGLEQGHRSLGNRPLLLDLLLSVRPMSFCRCHFLSISVLSVFLSHFSTLSTTTATFERPHFPLPPLFPLLSHSRYTILFGLRPGFTHGTNFKLVPSPGVTMAAEARRAYMEFMNGSGSSNANAQQQQQQQQFQQQQQGQWQPGSDLHNQYAAYAAHLQQQSPQGMQGMQNPYAAQQQYQGVNPVYVSLYLHPLRSVQFAMTDMAARSKPRCSPTL